MADVVFCLGAYTSAVPDVELRMITVDYTIEFARVLRGSSPEASSSFLGGNDADSTGRSRIPFARCKGEAENALLAAGFPPIYIFPPAYIYPVEPRKEPNFSYRLLRAIYPAFRVFPNQVIRADDLARAMVNVAVRRTGERGMLVFENRDIRGPGRFASSQTGGEVSARRLNSPITSQAKREFYLRHQVQFAGQFKVAALQLPISNPRPC